MKRFLVFIPFLIVFATRAQHAEIPLDTVVTSFHSTVIKGTPLKYKAQTGTMPLFDKNGKAKASIHYTYYQKTGVKDLGKRPIVLSFNGGPGSASVWMHIAYTGPKLLAMDTEGYPVQPYGIKDNPYSILDVADIVFINPVNTGYSRAIRDEKGKIDKKYFFGINADAKYLAEWISTFMSRTQRWTSPKYIIGESYGGTRVMQLAYELQNSQWMYLNGVIMVSPADYLLLRTKSSEDYAINFPYYTAAAWYHNKLPKELQEQPLEEILPKAEKFALRELLPALAQGAYITKEERLAIASKMAHYSGISKTVILRHNLELPNTYFWKELLRNEGKTIGRLDSRYIGIDRRESGEKTDFNPEIGAWLHAFTPAINYYNNRVLNFKTDVKYNMFGNVHPWDFSKNNARENLRKAMAQNPYLQVFVQSGYFDGATTYSAAKYTLGKIDPSGKMRNRLHFKAYKSGHMMYLRAADLKSANDDLRNFIQQSSQNIGAAKY